MLEANEKYTMQISWLTIDKLGIQMYDRVSAVLAELIANAYDADATNVTITLPFAQPLARKVGGQIQDQGYEIIIVDNGSGMTSEEVNKHYLNVGINRRTGRGDKTPGLKRRVMGRKGIGKLAPFGICHEVEVISAGGERTEHGFQVSNLKLNFDKILEDKTDEHRKVLPYYPERGQEDETYKETTGTTLILRYFNRKRVPTVEELDRQLSARFGLSQDKWKVRLVDSTREDVSTELGTFEVDHLPGTYIKVNDRPFEVDGESLDLKGWVAYAKDPYKDEVMAGVRLYARGKIVAQTRDFDIKSGFTGEFKMRSYLTGAITAEWLDEKDDLIRTDRQDIIWNSEHGIALREWGQKLLRELASKAEASTGKRTWDLFLEVSQLEKRLESVLPKVKDKDVKDAIFKAARSLVSGADRDSIKKPEFIERMVRSAFAIGPHQTLLDTLERLASLAGVATEEILDLFEKARLVEIYSLGQVAYERVRVIEQLRKLVSCSSTAERELQKLIESAPWILYPDWTPLSRNQSLESTRKNFQSWYQLIYGSQILTSTIDSPNKQPDFVMLNHAGRLEVIEIKRPKHKLEDEEFNRAFNYLEAVKEFIKNNNEVSTEFPEAKLTIVCDNLNLSASIKNNIDKDPDICRKTWHDLCTSSSRSHEDFLEVAGEFQGQLPEKSVESE